jgi:O-methyltransferase
MKWQLHRLVKPFTGIMLNAVYMSRLSKWRKDTTVNGYNDWFCKNWDYSRREQLYEAICEQEKIDTTAIDYLEFGVSSGASFKYWLNKNNNADSRFYGFDTFEGLPENFGPFGKGSMANSIESLGITDKRVTFYKGLFQDTLIPFLENYPNQKRKMIHMDADIFSATLFTLSQLHRFLKKDDIIIFDELAVPTHEFMALDIYTKSFYPEFEVIAAANNYMFVALKIKKDS